MEKLYEKFFESSITDREHAIFELGIKLATLYHLMLGAPIKNDPKVMDDIAQGLKATIECQPFVKSVDIKLKVMKEGMSHNYTKKHQFDYTTLSGKNITAQVEIQYKEWHITGRVEWSNDLHYPIMYIKDIKTIN